MHIRIFLVALLLLSTSPVIAFAQTSRPARSAHIPILIYHSVRPYYPGITNLVKEFTVPPEIFDDQMRYLRDNGFTPITFDDVERYFSSGSPLPAKPVIISLDDGWENQYTYAFPILKRYKYPSIFYVYPAAIGQKHFLTYPEIKEMVAAHMVIADHTQTHPELTKVKNDVDLNREISGSKDVLENNLHIPIKDFAYPFGAYNARTVAAVAEAGYRTGRTVHGGLTEDSTAPYTFDGIIITGDFNRFVSWVNK